MCRETSRSNKRGTISDGSSLISFYFCYPDAGHVFSGALAAASFAGMLILNRIDLKIDQRLLNKSGKPKEEKKVVSYVSLS